MAETAPLVGCTVVVTRERPGELGRLLDTAGAHTVHVPLIEIGDPTDGGAGLRAALERLDRYDWLVVTSPAGAERVGAAADAPSVRLAAVGTATAERLRACVGREIDLVPDRQMADELAAAFVARHDEAQRVLLALGDRAATTLSDRLRAAGHQVTTVEAYRTHLRRPTTDDIAALRSADAVLFASGSAAQSWAEALGDEAVALLPDLSIAIGPTTATAASESGLKVTSIAADQSLTGLVDELVRQWQRRAR